MRQRWGVDELIESWTLDPDDVGLVANKTGPTRLGFGVLFKFFELEARFPRSIDEVPIEVVDFVGRQLDVGFDAWLITNCRAARGNDTVDRFVLTSDPAMVGDVS